MRRGEAAQSEDSMKDKQPDDKEVVRTLVEKIPEDILRRFGKRKCHSRRKLNTSD